MSDGHVLHENRVPLGAVSGAREEGPGDQPRRRFRLPLVPLLAMGLVIAIAVSAPPPLPPPAPPVSDIQPPHQWQPAVLRVGIDAAYPPFATFTNGEYAGHDVEMAKLLASHLGLRLVIVNIPFDGLYDALRVSQIDVVVSALPFQAELSGMVIYSRPYFEAGEVLVVTSGSAVTDSRQLMGHRVGAELGSLGDQTARRLIGGGLQVQLDSSFISLGDALQSLQGGRLDGVIVDRVTALQHIRTEPLLRILEPPLSNEPYVIAVPYDEPVLAEAVNTWLDELRRDGTLNRLQAAYIR